jgi:DNA-binding HxlR family transcriptional regulator
MATSMKYGQFCPIARAAEVLGERWTTLVIRELHCGSVRFNDLQRGLPRMSSSLLSRRLKELEDGGLVWKRQATSGRGFEYRLTEAGRALGPVLEHMGAWAQQWSRDDLTIDDNLDPDLLMWDIRRCVTHKGIPKDRRFVVGFQFPNMPSNRRAYWLLFTEGQVELCYRDPGYDVDMLVIAHVKTLVEIWLGHKSIEKAADDETFRLEGDPKDVMAFRAWFTLSPTASFAAT